MKIQILTDAWFPQTSGVVTTLDNLVKMCERRDHAVHVIHPDSFKKTFPLPTYPEIRLPIDVWRTGKMIRAVKPDAVHMATPEGTIGIGDKLFCDKHRIPYTTSYHTKMPEYVRERFPIPLAFGYGYMRWVQKRARRILVGNESMRAELEHRGLGNLVVWARGVDREVFNPDLRRDMGFEKPIFIYVGRVAVEKGIDVFLEMDLPGTKVVVGGGPDKVRLERAFPSAKFLGYKYGRELGSCYASADVFVFPSRTDTFGVVMLESVSCGTPVAAFDVTGPRDVVTSGVNGYLGEDLHESAKRCLNLDRRRVCESSREWTWERCADIFLENLQPISWGHSQGPSSPAMRA